MERPVSAGTQASGGARSERILEGLHFAAPSEPLPFFLPAPSPDTDFFWRGEHDGILRLLTCASCGYITHPPGPRCGRCHGAEVAPQPVSGRGTLYAWTVNLQPFVPGLPPYCVASVRIDEQADVRLTTQLVECTYDEISEGMAVEVLLVPGQQGIQLPFFRPVRP